jgi:transposase
MAFREVTMLEVKEVLRRWPRRETKSEISRQCGVSRGTVRIYIRAAEEGGLSPGQAKSVLDDEQLAALAARLHSSTGRPRGEGWQRGDVRLTKIRKLLRRQKGCWSATPLCGGLR